MEDCAEFYEYGQLMRREQRRHFRIPINRKKTEKKVEILQVNFVSHLEVA